MQVQVLTTTGPAVGFNSLLDEAPQSGQQHGRFPALGHPALSPPRHLLFFFSCLAIFFSFGVFVGFFLVSFFASLVFIG